jgi:N-acyl-L-homoserine lactone synthetase
MQVVSGEGARLPDGYCQRVAQYRHRVFVERLGWQLNCQNGLETDQFDRPDTVYVAVENERSDIAGCARLLPTTKPYLLGEVFPQLLNGLPPPCDPTVWELSRFAAVDLNDDTVAPLAQISSSSTGLLLQGAISCAVERGAKRLLSISPLGIERLSRHLGLRARRAGPPMIIDGHAIMACWFDLVT